MRRRAIVRLTTRFILDYVGILSQMFDHDIVKGLVYLAICDANIGYIDGQADISEYYGRLERTAPDELRRPIRPHKLALSLGVPRETVRRKVSALIQEGWVVETDQGVHVPNSVLTTDAVKASLLENSRLLVELYTRLVKAGVPGASLPSANFDDLPHRAMARVAAGYCLRSLDEIRQLFDGDLLTGFVYCSVVNANTSYLDDLAVRAYMDLEDHVPDEARRPISALALAARTGLPRETVRRHIRKLEALGALRTVAGGLIAHQQHLRTETVVASTKRNAANLRLLMQELQAVGFPHPLRAAPAQRAV